MPVGRGWGAAGWGAAGRGRLPSFPLETLVTVPPSLLSVASIWGFIFLFMNLGNLCVFKKKKKKNPTRATTNLPCRRGWELGERSSRRVRSAPADGARCNHIITC